MGDVCYQPSGSTKPACGNKGNQTTLDMGQATCPDCYRVMRDGYDRTQLQMVDYREYGASPPTPSEPEPEWSFFNLDTVH